LDINNAVNSVVESYDISSILLVSHDGSQVGVSIVHHSGIGIFAFRKGNCRLIMGKRSGGFSNGLKILGIPVDTNGQLYYLAKDPYEHADTYALDQEK